MKIAVISACRESLSDEEFARPLAEIAGKFGKVDIVKKYREGYDYYIISGAPLMDFSYLERLEDFSELLKPELKVMGICAGWQIMLKLEDVEEKDFGIIGKRNVKFINGREEEAYFLFSRLYLPKGWKTLATVETEDGEEIPAMAVKGEKTITLFHPEVMNGWIIEDFLSGRLL